MSWICLMLCAVHTAIAQEPPATSQLQEETTVAPTWSREPGSLVAEAWRRIALGDLEGARSIARQGHEVGAPADELTYLEGVTLQLDDAHTEAVEAFDALIDAYPGTPRADDATFRASISLAELGAPEEARKRLKQLRPWSKLDAEDRAKVKLLDAAWTLESGNLRRGTKRLSKDIAAMESPAISWYAARARASLWRWALSHADELTLDGPDRNSIRLMQERGALLSIAEQQLSATVDLAEPVFIAEGLLRLGQSYEALHADLLSSTRPRLTSNQSAIYEQELQQRALAQRLKARRFYDLGLGYVEQIGWHGDSRAALEEALRRIETAIEQEAQAYRPGLP